MTKNTILVVDDEAFNRKIILDILAQSQEDYSVLSADNGKKGCELAEQFLPDVILMDWKMPEMTGIEAVKRLKSHEQTKDIPVLMITAVTEPENLKEAFEAGVVDYITKPVREIELLVRVRSALKTYLYSKEIISQKQEIEEQKKDITDSIRYAQHIQRAILPKTDEIQAALKESFVLFKPKDIVSGDFFWFHKQGTGDEGRGAGERSGNSYPESKKITPSSPAPRPPSPVFIAACDCTGHGVPGAFVSMMGNVFLNQIIIEKGIKSPGRILSLLNNEMKSVFTRTGTEQQASDGMDITLCHLSPTISSARGGSAFGGKGEGDPPQRTHILQFAGANNPLFLVNPIRKEWPKVAVPFITDTVGRERRSSLPHGEGWGGAIIKGDRQSIGGNTEYDYEFTNHEIELQKGDNIYIFSDGYPDQIGGPKERKFMSKRFKQLLLDIQGKDMEKQKQILGQTIEKWKGDLDQIDDILVIGVRV